ERARRGRIHRTAARRGLRRHLCVGLQRAGLRRPEPQALQRFPAAQVGLLRSARMRQGGLSRRAVALFEVACVAMLALAALGRFGLAQAPATLSSQSREDADRKSAGCMSCHTETDQRTMHRSTSVRLGCVDCHGGNAGVKGGARMVKAVPPPTPEETRDKGVLPWLVPFPRWELSQTGNPFRVFERGGRRRLEVGLPDREEEPGRPDKGLSPRGPGTLNRTDPIILGAQKTRLVDPLLSMLGTNDHPGDYRSSGCTACHVVYANDRSRSNSGPYASFGNLGLSQTKDPTIKKDEAGHPLRHESTESIPSAQCITCHMHPG